MYRISLSYPVLSCTLVESYFLWCAMSWRGNFLWRLLLTRWRQQRLVCKQKLSSIWAWCQRLWTSLFHPPLQAVWRWTHPTLWHLPFACVTKQIHQLHLALIIIVWNTLIFKCIRIQSEYFENLKKFWDWAFIKQHQEKEFILSSISG